MASPLIVTLTQDNFETEALKSASPVLVDFWAEWCGPCKMISPVLDELASEYQGKIKVAKVNVDEQQGLAAQFNVTAIPTLLIIKGGQVIEQTRGAKSKRDLKVSLDRAIA
jgi:thioredoxin 1